MMTLGRGALALAAVTVVVMLSGCSEAPQSEAKAELQWDEDANDYVMEEEVATGEAPLTLWVEYQEYGDALVKAFNERYPDVKVNVEIVAKVDASERMELDGEAGKGADVFNIAYNELPSAINAGTAAPIGKYQDALSTRVGETFTSVVSRDGDMYGVPIAAESIALFYNKTLLKKLTGSVEPATSWQGIRSLADEYNDSASNQWTIRFKPGEMYYAYSVLSSMGWEMYPADDLANPDLDSTKLTAGLEYYKTLRDIWDVNSADATYDSIENEFVKGETPYVITGPWTFSDFDAAAESEGFEYGVTTLPKAKGGSTASSLAGLSVGVVSGYTDYPAAARVLANFMASDAGAEALYSSTGAIPALTTEYAVSIAGLSDDPHATGILAQSQNADLVEEIPEYMYTVGNSLVSNVWDGVLSVAEAQEQAVRDYDNLSGLGE